jgi:kynurenine formamidase
MTALGEEEFEHYVRSLRTWGRWGSDDRLGALNLVDEAQVIRGVACVRTGKRFSMARRLVSAQPTDTDSPRLSVTTVADAASQCGAVIDDFGMSYHGQQATHLDALCHIWTGDGMRDGRRPEATYRPEGMTWGGIEDWQRGFVSRGVLLDVAAGRAPGYVVDGFPVTAEELTETARRQGVEVLPGDVLVVHCGREAWERDEGRPWGPPTEAGDVRPGLATDSLAFLAEVDCSLIVWDMMDARPNEYGVQWSVHAAVPTLGIGLLDNAQLGEVADECRSTEQWDFLVVAAPLPVVGGTGSLINPIAIL